MAPDSGTPDKNLEHSAQLPEFPGEEFLAHAGSQWKEHADARLANLKLLAVAMGFPPPSVASIVDIDLASLPPLPIGHRDYERRLEARTKIMAQNKANAEKRFRYTMDDWTTLYAELKKCTEMQAPVLSRELKDLCDLSVTNPALTGYYDGPRAYRMLVNRISPTQRSETDKDFYRKAEQLQRSSQLPDGAPAADYAKKALAFLVHIRPFLAQSYDDDDTTQYLIALMPKTLREGGRRIKQQLLAEGKYRDHMYNIHVRH